MGVFLNGLEHAVASQGGESSTFWGNIVQALDRLMVNRSLRAVPALAIRRSAYDFDRCRRLMRQGSIASATPSLDCIPPRGTRQTLHTHS
jgi:hypothetical protein